MRARIGRRFLFCVATTFALATLGELYTPSAAQANGRFPRAQVVEPVPRGDGKTVYVRTTFGLLVSHDAGESWAWLCEAALGYQGEWDPPLTVTKDARVWLGMADGLHVLADGGCSMHDIADLAGELVTDMTNTADDAWPIVATSSQPGRAGHIWRTNDGRHFSKLGAGLPNVHFDTLEIAASRPSRLYASGYLPGDSSPVHFWRSDDGGVTLNAIDPKLPRPGRLFIGAVDAKDPDRVIVRLLDENGSDILVSSNGGASFRSVLHFATSNYGFALSRDGANCYASSADAKDGIFVSHDRCATFVHGAPVGTFGMRTDDRGTLWALSNPFTPGGFFVGTSTDGVSFTPHGTFAQVGGPIGCDAGPALVCPAAWEAVHGAILGSAIAPLPAAEAASVARASTALSGSERSDADADAVALNGASPSPRSCSCEVVGAPAAALTGVRADSLYIFLAGAGLLAQRRTGARGARRDIADPGPKARRPSREGIDDGSFGHHG